MHSTVTFDAFVDPHSAEAVQIRNLVRRYRAAGVDAALTVVDPDAQPGRMKALGVKGYGSLLIGLDTRTELVDHFGEVAITSAIYHLSRPERPRACFLFGHGERTITDTSASGYSGFATSLRRLGYVPTDLALAAPGGEETLASCAIVVVGGGTVPLLPAEIDRLRRYTDEQGRILVFAEGGQTAPDAMNAILAGAKLSAGPGPLSDTSSLRNDPTSIVAFGYPSESPVTADLQQSKVPVVFVAPQPVTAGAAGAQDQQLGDHDRRDHRRRVVVGSGGHETALRTGRHCRPESHRVRAGSGGYGNAGDQAVEGGACRLRRGRRKPLHRHARQRGLRHRPHPVGGRGRTDHRSGARSRRCAGSCT